MRPFLLFIVRLSHRQSHDLKALQQSITTNELKMITQGLMVVNKMMNDTDSEDS
jgi:hypothetical protein